MNTKDGKPLLRVFHRPVLGGKAVVTDGRCPLCKGPGYWRQGVHFDHEKRCGDCLCVWEPGKEVWIVDPTEVNN